MAALCRDVCGVSEPERPPRQDAIPMSAVPIRQFAFWRPCRTFLALLLNYDVSWRKEHLKAQEVLAELLGGVLHGVLLLLLLEFLLGLVDSLCQLEDLARGEVGEVRKVVGGVLG